MGADGAVDLRTQPGPHVFTDDLEALEPDADDRHHLTRVLRLRSGDPLTVSDAHGRWRCARFGDHVEPSGPIVTARCLSCDRRCRWSSTHRLSSSR